MLFRQQVVKKRHERLYGAVIICTPMAVWVVAVFLTAVLAVSVTFAAVSVFARVEPVRGIIVPSGGIMTVRAASSGILSGFDLSEGDTVEAGQFIGQITTNGAIAGEGSRLEAELNHIVSQISRLEDQQQQSLTVAKIGLNALRQEETLLSDRIDRLGALLELRLAAAAETQQSYDRMLILTERNLTAERQLSEERLQVIAANQQVLELEGELAELSANLLDFPRRHEELAAQNRLTLLQFQGDIERLNAEREVLSGNESYAVVAPLSGRVSAVMARAGHEVAQGTRLLSILPLERALQAELYIPSRAIGFVEPGLAVKLLLDAYPYQRFGTASGVVEEVTTTVLSPSADDLLINLEEPVFRATVALHDDSVEGDGQEYLLQVGMTLTGNIILEERTLLSSVLGPVVSVLRRY